MVNANITIATWRLALVLLVALLGLNILLIGQNFKLRQQLARFALSPTALSEVLKIGETVPVFTGLDLQEQTYQLSYTRNNQRHLILYFSAHCSYCDQQAPMWRNFLNNLDNQQVTVTGIVSDEENKVATAKYAQQSGYLTTKTALPIVFVSKAVLAQYKLKATPTTLVISGEGKVIGQWIGLWSEATVDEVTAALR